MFFILGLVCLSIVLAYYWTEYNERGIKIDKLEADIKVSEASIMILKAELENNRLLNINTDLHNMVNDFEALIKR